MSKSVKFCFIIWFLTGLLSCETVKSTQGEISAVYFVTIRLQNMGYVSAIVTEIQKKTTPTDMQIIEYSNASGFQTIGVRIRYDTVTDEMIQLVIEQLSMCQGVLDVNIKKV